MDIKDITKIIKTWLEPKGFVQTSNKRLFVKDKGFVLVQSGIEDENEKKATDAILAELKNMKDGKFTAEDIENSKKGLTDAFLSVGDTPESIDAWIGTRVLDEEIIMPQDYAEKINLVTADEIRKAAEKITLDTVYMLSGDGSAEEE